MPPRRRGASNDRAGRPAAASAASAAGAQSPPAPDAGAGTRFRSSFDQVAVGIAHTTIEGRILEVNHQLCEMLGYSAAELRAMSTRDLTHPEDRDRQDGMRHELIEGVRNHFSGDKRYLRKDGSVLWVSRTVALAREATGGGSYLIQTIDDITARKLAEGQLARERRAHRVMAECGHILVHATEEIAMLQSMCRIAVESGGYNQAWIGLPASDTKRLLRPIVHAGYHDDGPMTAPATFSSDGRYQGLAADAFVNGETRIARDIPHNPHHERMRERARHLGYQSSIALPLVGDGELLGVMVLHAAETDAFDTDELALLNAMAGDIGYGIASLRTRIARKEAEEHSRENERRFSAIFDQAAVGITRVDLEGTLLDVNQKFCDMLGYTREELVGKTVRDVTYPDDYGKGAQYRVRLSPDTVKPLSGEKRFLHKDGSTIWTRRTVSVARDDAGRPIYLISVIEDITARREIDERYRATFDNAPVGIMHTAIGSYRILHVNPKLCAMLGYTEAELLSMTSTDFVHPDFRFTDTTKYQDPILQGEASTFSSERKYLRKDGSSFWVNRTVSLAHDAAGKPLYFIRIIEDITERKQAEEAIVRERALLRTIIDALPDLIYVKDRDGKFLLANKAWLTARGERLMDIAGKTVHDYFTPEVAVKVAAQDAEIINTGVPLFDVEQKLVVKDRDGVPSDVRWSSTTKVPLLTTSAEIIGTAGISRDITEQKRADARRAMAHAVTQVLADAVTSADAMPRILRIMCETMGWAYGARWTSDERDQRLVRAEYWCEGEPEFDPADRELWHQVPYSGSGRFLRRAWVDRTATWLTNLHDEKPFRRKASVVKLGWHSAYVFPIQIGGKVIGIMEFFGTDIREPDEALVQSTTAISSQIGQFIQRKEAEDKIAFLAQFDTVTGLPNRFLFSDRLDQLLTQSQRNRWTVGVLFVDLDRFKAVNDTYGHAAGDQLLRLVAVRIKECIRGGDTVGRLSGDEFAVMLANLAKADDAGMVAQKIVEALAAPFDLDSHQVYVSASIGIALYPGDGGEPDTLLKNADTAMYRAKEQGRNGYQYYLPQMNERQIRRQQLDLQLRGALDRKEFLLHFQPKVSLVTGAITGFEALLRWQRGETLVPPAEFISILEETGLIVPVGEWVLQSVCDQIKAWEQAGVTPLPVAVNLSARQFQRKNLADLVGNVLRQSGVKPALLALELTESLLMSDAREAVETLHQLKFLGVQLSVDDFGTGYSSLAYLKRFPLDEIKIDREFIRDAISDPDDAAIAIAIINLAHSLKLKVVAEGAETEGQFNFLRTHGCDEMQGFYFARPLPAADCTRMLVEDSRLPMPQAETVKDAMILLLVIDNEEEQQRLTRALAPEDFRLLTARTAADGFEILARHGADIVVSASDLPGMNGIEFLTRVRKLYVNTVRVLASSGGEIPTLTRATNRAGIHLFLPRDWAPEKLCAEVRGAMESHNEATLAASGQYPVLQVPPE